MRRPIPGFSLLSLSLCAALLGTTAAARAAEDLASLGLREDGGKPLAALRLKLPQTMVIIQAPVSFIGGHTIEIRRELAPSISLGGTYRYNLNERFESDRFGLKLTITR
jgi:hypothetical protein